MLLLSVILTPCEIISYSTNTINEKVRSGKLCSSMFQYRIKQHENGETQRTHNHKCILTVIKKNITVKDQKEVELRLSYCLFNSSTAKVNEQFGQD